MLSGSQTFLALLIPIEVNDGSNFPGNLGAAATGSSERLHRWYLVLTKPLSEEIATVNLERQGYGVYYPRLHTRALRRGRWTERIVALFPRYLFVRLDAKQQALAPVRSTLGVVSVVRFGRDYTVVPDRVVKLLQSRAEPDTGLHRCVDPPLRRGARVKVGGARDEGLDAIFQHAVGQDRVVVLLNLLGREVMVRVPADDVRPSYAA